MLKSAMSNFVNKAVTVVYDRHTTFQGVVESVDNIRDLLIVKGIDPTDIHNLVINVERVIDIFLT